MSVEIDWQALTTGPDGDALAESIRDFIHDKFQQVRLPKFIRSVRVHSFEFGNESPSVVLKDVCDPLDEFYDDDDDDDDEDESDSEGSGEAQRHHERAGNDEIIAAIPPDVRAKATHNDHTAALPVRHAHIEPATRLSTSTLSAHDRAALASRHLEAPKAVSVSAGNLQHQQQHQQQQQHRPGAGLRTLSSFVDQLASPLLSSRAGTPGIPGGTANLGYFHHAHFAHHQSTFPAPWSGYNFARPREMQRGQQQQQQIPPGHTTPLQPLTPLQHQVQSPPPGDAAAYSAGDPSTRPSTATTQTPLSRVPTGSQEQTTPGAQKPTKSRRASRPKEPEHFPSSPRLPSPGLSGPSSTRPEPNPQDLQLVLHVRYNGGVRLALSAEILLDYPMSSFVSIPLQLTITGVSFDGVAILAHVRPPMAQTPPQQQEDSEEDDDAQAALPSSNRGRAHICFLGPEDARALLGTSAHDLGSFDTGDEGLAGENVRTDFSSSSPPVPNSPTPRRKQSHGFPLSSPGMREGTASPAASPAVGDNHSTERAGYNRTASAPHLRNERERRSSDDDSGGDDDDNNNDNNSNNDNKSTNDEGLGGLLKEIRVESEIGQRREGQHSLRNVGKVEKFVLEQVRRIFEDEFVWPSFWTFLL